MFLDRGQLVGALFGLARGLGGAPADQLRGLAALDAIVLLMPEAAFFVTGDASPERNITSSTSELDAHLENLHRERFKCRLTLSSLLAAPVHALAAEESNEEDQLTIDRGKLRLLVAINGERTVLELLKNRDVPLTIQNLGWLTENGLVYVPA